MLSGQEMKQVSSTACGTDEGQTWTLCGVFLLSRSRQLCRSDHAGK